jgi:hypothetical protein
MNRFTNSIFSKLPISNFIHWQFLGKLPIPMKYCKQRPELSIDEPTSQLSGLGAELWSPEKSDPLVMGHAVPFKTSLKSREHFRNAIISSNAIFLTSVFIIPKKTPILAKSAKLTFQGQFCPWSPKTELTGYDV